MPFQRSFYFIRHGQTDWNLAKKLQGHTDIPLNETGKQQAKDAAKRVEGLDISYVVTSPLSRAYDTAQKIAEHNNWDMVVHAGLIERSFGDNEGKHRDDVLEHERDVGFADFVHPNGEMLVDVIYRLKKAINELQMMYEGNLLLVSHGAVFRSLQDALWGIEDIRPGTNNAVPHHFNKIEDGWEIQEIK